VTVQDIVSLSKSGVSEAVILALIDRDKTIFTMAPEQIVALKNEGVSEPVVIAMLRSGRQEPPPPEPIAQPVPIADTEPNIVVVGRGPDRPNSTPDQYGPMGAAPYPVPYYVPVPYAVGGIGPQSRCVTTAVAPNPLRGQFFTNPTAGQFFAETVTPRPAPQVVIDCPRPPPHRHGKAGR
jgi:hypothetical protein